MKTMRITRSEGDRSMFSANVGLQKTHFGRKMDQSPTRAGFSLLEVILATALLMGCGIVLAELANIGREHARAAEQLAAAQLVCQSRLNAILCGAASVEDVEDQPLDELPGWLLSVDTRSVVVPGMVALRVTVAEEEDDQHRRSKQFSLIRWIRKPEGDRSSESSFVTEPWSESHPEEEPAP
jgi:hypothetical protein